jgi:PAS domain S-box-containing protein
VAVITAVRLALNGPLGTRPVYIFYFVALTVSALYGGFGPGLAALAVSSVASVYFFLAPQFELALPQVADWVGLAAYLVPGTLVVAVTARERASRARSFASELRYRALVETSRDLIWAFDLEGRVTFINQQASVAVLGCDADEVIGRPWSEFVVAEELPEMAAKFEQVLSGQTLHHVPLTAIRKGGAPVNLLVNAVSRLDGEGRVVGVTGTAVDVTDQRIQERNLQLFRLLMDQSADGIMIVDEATRAILDANQTVCLWLGYSREELLGRNTEELLAPHPTMSREERREEVYRLGHSSDPAAAPPVLELEYRRRDGVTLPREVGFRFVSLQGREYIVSVARDVSERGSSSRSWSTWRSTRGTRCPPAAGSPSRPPTWCSTPTPPTPIPRCCPGSTCASR